MKRIVYTLLMAGTILSASNFDIGISGSNGKIEGFSLSVGEYYRVPKQEIIILERRIPRDEMSVVYYLARKAHRDVAFITDLRLRGDSWWDITLRLGLDPKSIYTVKTQRKYGPPYGKGYGYHKDKKYRLHDHEIIDLVNVRFLSDYHRISVDDVIERRRGGEGYHRIDEYYHGKKFHKERSENHRNDRSKYDDKRDKGHGFNKGNER
jgi:hypothetical protein